MLAIAPICFTQNAVIPMHRSYALLFVTNADGVLNVDGHIEKLVSGRIFLLKKAEEVRMYGKMLIGHIVEFQQVLLDLFFAQHVRQIGKGIFNPDRWVSFADHQKRGLRPLMDLIGLLNDEMELSSAAEICKTYLLLLLLHTNREVLEMVPSKPETPEDDLMKLMALIEEHYKSNKKAGFYAKKLGMTPRRLNDFCKEHGKLQCNKEIIRRRMIEAELLLRTTNLEIKYIVPELGFANHEHLNYHFKEYKGITPAKFRERLSKTDDES